MKTVTIICALMLSGCALTPTQKKVATGVAVAVAVGMIAAHQRDHKAPEPTPPVRRPFTCSYIEGWLACE